MNISEILRKMIYCDNLFKVKLSVNMAEKTLELKTHIGEFKFRVGKDYTYTSKYVYHTFINTCTLTITPRYGKHWINEFTIHGNDSGECKTIENFYEEIQKYSFKCEKIRK